MLINRSGEVLVGRRIGAEAWQMPQGGIIRGESPRDAMLRELSEEIGTNQIEILAESESWHSYDTPGEFARAETPTQRWRGQRQKWFLCLFTGSDAEIKLGARAPEFDAWQWVRPEDLPARVAPFKRQLYSDLIAEFRSRIDDLVRRLRARPTEGRQSVTEAPDLEARRSRFDHAPEIPIDGGPLAITDGEVNFIEGFVHDGSIGAECGQQLIQNWGYCERHAWVSLAVEMSALHGFCSRSATLYTDILRQAVAALAPERRAPRQLLKALKAIGGCMICKANPTRRGVVETAELVKAKDPSRLRSFAEQTAEFWRADCCPRCTDGNASGGQLCRLHLVEAVGSGAPLDLEREHQYLLELLARLNNFAWSFSWGFRGIDGPEDRAALISAIAWCSGWPSLDRIAPLRRSTATSQLGSLV